MGACFITRKSAVGAGTGMRVYQAKKGVKWSIVGITGLDIIKAEFE